MCAFLPGRNPHISDFSPGEIQKPRNYHGQRGNSKQHAIFPQEKCNTCDFLPGRNATHASFSPGEMQQVRISPQEKSTHIGFLPGRNPKTSEKSRRGVYGYNRSYSDLQICFHNSFNNYIMRACSRARLQTILTPELNASQEKAARAPQPPYLLAKDWPPYLSKPV
jgi:hypothetical protein